MGYGAIRLRRSRIFQCGSPVWLNSRLQFQRTTLLYGGGELPLLSDPDEAVRPGQVVSPSEAYDHLRRSLGHHLESTAANTASGTGSAGRRRQQLPNRSAGRATARSE